MKHLGWKLNLIGVISGLLLTACGLLGEETTEPVVLIPTGATIATVAPTEPIIAKPDVTEIATDFPTEVPTETQAVVVETNTPPSTPTPAPAVGTCSTPVPPEGVFFASHTVQPGDTLFAIGQKANPQMSVDEIAALNCILDVNRIEVGQEVIIWGRPAGYQEGGAVTQVVWEPGMVASFKYDGPLALGKHNFVFTARAGDILGLHNIGSFDIAQKAELIKNDTEEFVAQVPFMTRTYLDLSKRGGQVAIPTDGEYTLTFLGRSGTPLNFELALGPLEPSLGKPTPIQFDAGATSTDISGVHQTGLINRYKFTAFNGQILTLTPADSTLTLLVEKADDLSARSFLLRTDGEQKQVTLPADGEYIISTCFCRWEGYWPEFGYKFGDAYSFNMNIGLPQEAPTMTPTATPTPASSGQNQTLVFNEVMNGWLAAEAKGTVHATGASIFNFTLPGNGNLSLTNLNSGALGFTLLTDDGATVYDSFNTRARNHLLPTIRQDAIFLSAETSYWLRVNGSAGAEYDFNMLFGGPPHPEMGTPERVQFESGATSAQIAGESARDQYGQGAIDRYVFTAAAGQNVTIVFGHAGITNVMIEDSNQNIILNTVEGLNGVTLPADGDYIMNVWNTGGEVYGAGPYDFTLIIE